ncbi:MAG: hypothetical protein M0D54_09320 [Hyphomonadaceae bacterium JAD_PAG50586_4]|nr:MAG: hypothetical protein M0D54_09320 [Hyphomonadaceae bacterium JAD_PAG50586_4]
MSEAPVCGGAWRRVLSAAAIYFVIVFAVGLSLGPVRVLWLEPWIGRTLAVLCEAPFLLIAMWFAARWAPGWVKLEPGSARRLGVGVVALAFQQVADLAVGFGLRGMNLSDQIAYFATLPGIIYIAILIIFATMPLMAALQLARRET